MKKFIYGLAFIITILFLFKLPLSYMFMDKENFNYSTDLNTVEHTDSNIISEGSQITNEIKNSEKKLDLKKDILLVNKDNIIGKNYSPKKLKVPNVKFISYADPNVKSLDEEAAYALEELFKGASKENITLLAVSGYRSYSYQNMLYNNKVNTSGKIEADKYVSKPGASEHQTGLAMDILSSEYSKLDEGFAKTKAYKWLKENCSNYGFIIRYPKGKENITKYNFEPWHIRYVGSSHSKEITNKNLTLEEYLNKNV